MMRGIDAITSTDLNLSSRSVPPAPVWSSFDPTAECLWGCNQNNTKADSDETATTRPAPVAGTRGLLRANVPPHSAVQKRRYRRPREILGCLVRFPHDAMCWRRQLVGVALVVVYAVWILLCLELAALCIAFIVVLSSLVLSCHRVCVHECVHLFAYFSCSVCLCVCHLEMNSPVSTRFLARVVQQRECTNFAKTPCRRIVVVVAGFCCCCRCRRCDSSCASGGGGGNSSRNEAMLKFIISSGGSGRRSSRSFSIALL